MAEYYKIKEDVTDLQSALQLVKQRAMKTECVVAPIAEGIHNYDFIIAASSELALDLTASADGCYTLTVDNVTCNSNCRFTAATIGKGRHSVSLSVAHGESAMIRFYGCGLKVVTVK